MASEINVGNTTRCFYIHRQALCDDDDRGSPNMKFKLMFYCSKQTLPRELRIYLYLTAFDGPVVPINTSTSTVLTPV